MKNEWTRIVEAEWHNAVEKRRSSDGAENQFWQGAEWACILILREFTFQIEKESLRSPMDKEMGSYQAENEPAPQ